MDTKSFFPKNTLQNFYNPQHLEEWRKSGISDNLTALNLYEPSQDEIADFYFQHLPHSARKNNGQIRTGYLKAYDKPLQGGWAILGYDPFNLNAEPEIRCFKPDRPRIGQDGKAIKYDFPKNGTQAPIFPRINYETAEAVFRTSGLSVLQLSEKYAFQEIGQDIDETQECKWFWLAVLNEKSINVSIAEGGKKQFSLFSEGRCAIAVTSITTWRAGKGSNRLHPWLEAFVKDRRIFIAFDRDIKPKTVRAVNNQAKKLGNALVTAGAAKVRRLSWDGAAKGIDDLIFSLSSRYGNRYCQKVLQKCYANARSYVDFGIDESLPGKVVNVNRRFLGQEELKAAEGFKIIVWASGKSTGKTTILEDVVRKHRCNHSPTIVATHLRRLGVELCDRLDLPYRTEKDSSMLRNSLGYGLCLDSFHQKNSVPFRPESWRDSAFVMDEFTQGLKHLAFGRTDIKKHRLTVEANLAQKLADCWDNDQEIHLADADADRVSIELIYELIQLKSSRPVSREELEASTVCIKNSYMPKKFGKLKLYAEKSPRMIRGELKASMERGEKLLLLTDTKKANSGDGSKNLWKYAQKYYHPKEILRIDSDTTCDPEHPAFNITGQKISEYFRSGTYKVAIASPSLSTGTSIDGCEGIFDNVFCFQSGNQPVNAILQVLVRLRDFAVDRHVWLPKTGKSFIGSKSTNPIQLLTDEKQQADLAIGCVDPTMAQKALDSGIFPLNTYWAKCGAAQNRENYIYRDAFIEKAQRDGWEIEIIAESTAKDSKAWQLRKQVREESKMEEYQSLTPVRLISEVEAKRIEKSGEKTERQNRELRKYTIASKYAVEEKDITPELVEADSLGLYPALRLRFWLSIGRGLLKQKDRKQIKAHKERNQGQIFAPDLNREVNIVKVKLLEDPKLNLKQFLKPGKEWSNKSLKLRRIKEYVIGYLVHFNQVLKCGIHKDDSPITVIQKILKKVGYKLEYLRNERDGKKKRLRVYGAAISKFSAVQHLEKSILQGWLVREKREDEKSPDYPQESQLRGIVSGAG